MKNIFNKYLFSLFNVLLLISFFGCFANADVIYNFSGKKSLVDVNPNIKQKTQTQYKAGDKIKNQYKGKLKYRPNVSTTNYRDGRVYVNFYANIHSLKYSGSFKYNNIEYNRSEYINKVKTQNSFDIDVIIGYYITQNLLFEIEYSNYEYSTFLNNNKYLYFAGKSTTNYRVNKLNNNFTIYGLNFLVENNYSKVIPFFGIGLGYMKNGYTDSFYVSPRGEETVREESDIRFKEKFIYTLMTGIDINITEKVLLSFRYKHINSLNSNIDIRNKLRKLLRKKKKIDNSDTLDFNFNINSFAIGVKYLW